MTCYSPLKGYRASTPNANGKYPIVFNPAHGYVDQPVQVPCGQCIGCRLERSRAWAVRCVHEASLHAHNTFITLTYRDECLPEHNSLQLKDFQKFMKRLRKKYGDGIRFYHCGEYGENFGRPHYYAILFGIDFSDKKLFRTTKRGDKLYTSDSLSKLWPYGWAIIGSVTFESAAYVARYIMKKVLGPSADAHYGNRVPEYTTMSRRPGIAAGWFEKFKGDVYPSDNVVHAGRVMRPPKYYDRAYEIHSPAEMEAIKIMRRKKAQKHIDNNTPERLRVREAVKMAQISTLTRKLS